MERHFLKGLPVSDGVGIGRLYVLKPSGCEINKGTVARSKVNDEVSRLYKGISSTLGEFQQLKNLLKKNNLIFEVYEAILRDSLFIDEIIELIRNNRIFADNAVDICIKKYVSEIEQSSNEYARQRVYDLNDLGAKIIRNMAGQKDSFIDHIYRKQIIAVRELTPSLTVLLGKRKVMGIVAYGGAAYFSHSAIMLRSLGIPVLNDINYDFMQRFDGQQAIIDGTDGFLIINPDKDDNERYRNILKSSIKKRKELMSHRHKPALTRDGCRIAISANISSVEECEEIVKLNADGIGLVRTEMLFAAKGSLPDETEQTDVYCEIAERMRNRPVVIRTWDIGEEKVLGFLGGERLEAKSRSIENSLVNRDEFRTQIRSILRAAEHGNIKITFPMVDSAEQLRQIKSILIAAESKLEEECKKKFKIPQIGAFIETKTGIMNLDEILPLLDFINLGTNDLLQHTLGKAREFSRVKKNEYYNPQFLKTVDACIRKAKLYKKHVCVCGEMASDPAVSILLIGMGIDELSMNSYRIPVIKELLSRVSIDEARQLAKSALEASSIAEVKRILTKKYGKVVLLPEIEKR